MKVFLASLLLVGCATSHDVDRPDAHDGGRSDDAALDAGAPPIDAEPPPPIDAGPALAPGEVRCTRGAVCPVGFDCCPSSGCVPHDEVGLLGSCLLCDDDSDCNARGTPGVCCEGPYSIGGGLRWACVEETMCSLRVCPPGEDCLIAREELGAGAPIGQVECNTGYYGYRTCDVNEACCRGIDQEYCTEQRASYPTGSVCSECNVDQDCVFLGLGTVCCSVDTPTGYIGRRCRTSC
jgi:hypothetical protein